MGMTRRLLLLAAMAVLASVSLVCRAAGDEARTADRLMAALLSGDRAAAGELEILGKRGVARADTVLAFAYQEGKLGARDPGKARALYQRAAEAGDLLAQYRLHELLRSSDPAQAQQWIVRAAEQGHALAQTYALMEFKQRVEPRRPMAEILREFDRWAEDGNVLAMFDLSYRYEVGRYIPEDLQRAAALMRRAAEAGFAQAQSTLGTKYLTGRGVPADDAEAAKWFLRAAEQGSPIAYFFLGTMYHDGRGVERDRAQALQWFDKAAEQGIEPARQQAEQLRSRLRADESSPADLARQEPLPQVQSVQRQRVATLVAITGSVEVRSGSSGEWRAARKGQELLAGDFIRTLEDSMAAILFSDKSQVKVGQKSQFELKAAGEAAKGPGRPWLQRTRPTSEPPKATENHEERESR